MRSVILKSIFALLFLPVSYTINSQTVAQGVWTIGGSVGFSSSKQEGAGKASNLIELLPEAGYFIIDNLGVGLNGTFSRTSEGNTSLSEYAMGPWARYYVYQNAFAQASFQAGSITIDGDFGKAKTPNTKIEVGLGYSAWLADAVAMEPLIFYNISRSKDENTDPLSTNAFGLRIGLKIFLGEK